MNSKPFNNILVRAPNWLGDTVMATPAVALLRRAFPGARLTLLTRAPYHAFWAAFPGVDQSLVLDRSKEHKSLFGLLSLAGELRRDRFDAAVAFTESLSTAFLLFASGIPNRLGYAGQGRSFLLSSVVRNAVPRSRHWVVESLDLLRRGWGLDAFSSTMACHFPVTRESTREADRLLPGKPSGGWVAFVPGATYGPTKRWPIHHWRVLRDRILQKTRASVVLLGSRGEEGILKAVSEGLDGKRRTRVVALPGRTSLLGLGAVLKKCRVTVSNDTGPLHVSAAVGTPVVGLYGSSSPTWTRPLGRGHQVLYRHVECSPCFLKECPIDLRCLTGIRPEEVWAAARPYLTGPVKRVQGEKLSPEAI